VTPQVVEGAGAHSTAALAPPGGLERRSIPRDNGGRRRHGVKMVGPSAWRRYHLYAAPRTITALRATGALRRAAEPPPFSSHSCFHGAI